MNKSKLHLPILFASTSLCMNLKASIASAHPHLLDSTPAKDSLVHTQPSTVVLHFSEDLELAMCKLEVKNLKSGEIVGKSEIANERDDKKSLKADLKSLGSGKAEFEVSWKAVGKDSHRMPGKYTFTFDPKN